MALYKRVIYCKGCRKRFFPKYGGRAYCEECSPRVRVGHHEYAYKENAEKFVEKIAKKKGYRLRIKKHVASNGEIRYYVNEVNKNGKERKSKKRKENKSVC
jgi:uncharacterized 2Fe-2S/4Fe-4S cluster protein (DUF4445 family)